MKHERPGIELSGQPLGFAEMVRIGSGKAALSASQTGMARIRTARAIVEEAIEAGTPVYGSTTGVGAMKDVEWSADELDAFNLGLVRAHHFGTGAPFSCHVVRNAMAIRINTALTGRVGCSRALVDAYLALLAKDVVPVVRRTGSIGTADIGLMGQIGAVLTGVGEAVYQSRRMSAEAALAEAGLQPCRMAPRDSLASISVNAVGFAAAAEADFRKRGVQLRVHGLAGIEEQGGGLLLGQVAAWMRLRRVELQSGQFGHGQPPR